MKLYLQLRRNSNYSCFFHILFICIYIYNIITMFNSQTIDRVYSQLIEKDNALGYERNKVIEQTKKDLYLLIA